ncbi:MAG: diacylglycerol/polyprenol kinase family protein [Candidatus Zixiibacteriota bacterium]
MVSSSSSTSNQISFFHEILRKATHMGALIIPGGYYFLKLEKKEMLMIMVPITVLMIIIDISRLRQWSFWQSFAKNIVSPIIRQHEIEGDFTGASYILISVCLTVALYSKPIAVAALAFIIVGDSLAALIGRKFGRHKFGHKSIEGSMGCLLGTMMVAIFVPDLSLQIAVSGAVVATIIEAFPMGVDDNVSVPIISGLFMTLLEKFFLFFR